MFYWVPKNSKFDKTDPLVIHCKLKVNFYCQESIIIHGCLLTREFKQKKNPIFIFKSVCIHLRECPLMGMCKYRV